MKHKIYKGGVDNYPLWWYGQKSRLTNFGNRPNFLVPNGPVFKRTGYYFRGYGDHMVDAFGRSFPKAGTGGIWSYMYLTNSEPPFWGNLIGTGDRFYFPYNQDPKIAQKVILHHKYCPNLATLSVAFNRIPVLDVSEITALTFLDCHINNLSVLDVSNLVLLSTLLCHSNNLSVLDVSNLVLLVTLKCGNSKLTALDVSKNNKITLFGCSHCLFDSAMVDTILCDANAWNTSNGTLDISGNTAPSSTGTDCANDMINRNWTVTTD